MEPSLTYEQLGLYVWICEHFHDTHRMVTLREVINKGYAKSTSHASLKLWSLAARGYLEQAEISPGRYSFKIVGVDVILPSAYAEALEELTNAPR